MEKLLKEITPFDAKEFKLFKAKVQIMKDHGISFKGSKVINRLIATVDKLNEELTQIKDF